MPISSPTRQFRVSETANATARSRRDKPVAYRRTRTPACMRRPLFDMK